MHCHLVNRAYHENRALARCVANDTSAIKQTVLGLFMGLTGLLAVQLAKWVWL